MALRRQFMHFKATAVLFIASAASVQGHQVLIGPTDLGDFCGYNLNGAGGPGGIGAGPSIPTGIWAYPSCGTQLGSIDCLSSPLWMGWFDPSGWNGSTYSFRDEKCCEAYKVRNKYQVFMGGAPLDDTYFYACDVY